MGNFVIISSNSGVGEDDVALHVTISQNIKPFNLKGMIKIYNVFDVVNDTGSSVAIKQNPGGKSDFRYNKNKISEFHSFDTTGSALKSFDITIKGKRNKDFQSPTELKIEIPTGTDSPEIITFEVFTEDKNLKIDEFKASSYIVQEGDPNLELRYKIEDKEAEWTLFENNEVWSGNLSEQPIVIGFGSRNKPSGLYEYTLQAKKGNQTVCKKINIIYVQKTQIVERLIPNNKKIINFCAAQNEDYLYTLMYTEREDIFEIGFTDQIDGKDTWAIIKITDQQAIRLFATSPMLHLQSDDEKNTNKLGRILFIGGSKIGKIQEAEDIADKVAIINLYDATIKVYDPENLTSKFGHTCILFPKGDAPNTIWLMGGQDEYGQSTNDILTSSDGETWTVQKKESPLWSARCMLSASVSWKYEGKERKKEALWLGGGFEDFAGSGDGLQKDIWQFDDKDKWKPITFDQTVIAKNSLACALAYGGLAGIGHTGIFVLGNTNDKGQNTYFLGLRKNNVDEYVLNNADPEFKITHFNQGAYITAFFRECMWVMGLSDTGLKGITPSRLFYRIPRIDQETTNFYNNKLK